MSKLLIFLMGSLCIAQFAFAVDESLSGKKIEYKGQKQESFQLVAPRAVTRYRTETFNTTCTRSVAYQDRVCHTEYRNERYCHYYYNEYRCDYQMVPYEKCEDQTRYHNESYACTETRQVPYTVYEGEHIAEVTLNFIDRTKLSLALFDVQLSSTGKIKVNAIDKADQLQDQKIILLTNQSEGENRQGNITSNLEISFLPRQDYMQFMTVPVTLIDFNERSAQFKMGKVTHLENAEIYFVLQQSFHTLLSKKINLKDLLIETLGDHMLVTVDFTDEIGALDSGSYKILINQEIKFPNHLKILNDDSFEVFSPKRYWFKEEL